MATKYIGEVLKELNSAPNLFNTDYKKSGNGGPLGIVFKHAFTKSGKFVLPDGVPPFKEAKEPLGMTPGTFITETRKFHYFCNTNLTATKREMLFVQLCESIHPDEAKILIAVKDQKLHELYPNITPRVVAEAGFIYLDDMIEVAPVKSGARSKKAPETGKSDSLQGESHNE